MPLLNHWPVHFVGNYKNGIPHGTFWIAKSGRQDDYFEYKKNIPSYRFSTKKESASLKLRNTARAQTSAFASGPSHKLF